MIFAAETFPHPQPSRKRAEGEGSFPLPWGGGRVRERFCRYLNETLFEVPSPFLVCPRLDCRWRDECVTLQHARGTGTIG